MAKKIEFYIPFDENIGDGEWKFFFPIAKVHHMGQTIDFTRERGENMVSNFKNKIPDFDLPINILHDDGLGIYGHIADLRLGDRCVEWLPNFNDGAVDEIKAKGYKYASPEIIFDGFQGVYDGKYYSDVALAIAITPRPRLGRDTLVFSEGEWIQMSGDDEDTEEIMPEVKLNDEQFDELNKSIGARIGEFFVKLLGGHEDEVVPDPEPEPTPEPVVPQETELQEEQEPEMSEEEKAEFAEKLEEKDSKILELEEKMQELEEKAQKYDEQLRLAEEEAEKERQNARKLAFSETAKEIHGLPEMELDFAEELMWLEDADESDEKVHFNTILNVLKALGEQQKTAELFSEKGNDSSTPQSVNEKVDALVAAKVKEGKDIVEAYEEVFGENPGLYKEYDEANTKTLKSKRE
jgi:hypothetical protein